MAKDPDPDVLTDPYAGGGRKRDESPPSSGPPSSEMPESSTGTPGSPVAHGRGLGRREPRVRRRRRWLWRRAIKRAFAVFAVLAILGGASFAVWRWGLPLLQKQRQTSLFPTGKLGFLPPDFAVLQRWENLETEGVDPLEEARWSYFSANFCGGGDLFRSLAQSDRPFGREQVATLLASPRAERDSLRCGRAFAEAAEPEIFVVHMTMPSKVQNPDADLSADLVTAEGVVLVEASIDDAPPSQRQFHFARESRGLGEVRCALPIALGTPECSAGAPASAHLEASPFWVGASLGSIKRLGRGVSLGAQNEHPDAEDIALIAEKAPRAKRLSLGRGGHFNVDYLALLGVPEAPRDPLEALRRALSEHATLFVESDDTTFEGGVYVLTLLVESDADALTAEELLRNAHAATLEAPDRPTSRDVEPLAARFDEIQRAAAIRAIRAVTILRDERWLVATYDLGLTQDEADVIETWRVRYNERRRAAAAVVRRIHDGDPIPNDLWMEVGGTELLSAVLGGRNQR